MIKQDAEALQTLRNTLTVYNECSADITTILKQHNEEKKKESEESRDKKKILSEAESAHLTTIALKIRDFYASELMVDHMRQLNDSLAILQSTG